MRPCRRGSVPAGAGRTGRAGSDRAAGGIAQRRQPTAAVAEAAAVAAVAAAWLKVPRIPDPFIPPSREVGSPLRAAPLRRVAARHRSLQRS